MKPIHETGRACQEDLNEQLSNIQQLLSNVLETRDSSPQPGRNLDPRSRFWTTYEDIAQKDDNDVLDRYNGSLDVLLIFAGLFSGVSSSFIANNESNLQPDPMGTTNALLQLLVQAAYNQTSDVTSIIPSTSDPTSNVIWTQGLAYASLSLSLLTAFMAVLGKQWLGHYKNTRFGHGPQEERCIRRQLKLLAIDRSYLYLILDCLPFLLQLSLLSFGISLAGSIYVEQPVLGFIIIGMISSGIILYSSTALAGFLSNNSPYQTGITSGLRRHLPSFSNFSTDVKRRFHNYTTLLKSQYRRYFYPEVYSANPFFSDSTLNTEERRPQKVNMTEEESSGHWAVKWVLETSTDPEVIDTVIDMIPEVVWPADIDRACVLRRLRSHYAERTRHIHALSTTLIQKARACDRAIMHLLWAGHTAGQDYARDRSSPDAPPMIWLSLGPNFREYSEHICSRLYYDERYRRRIRPIHDPDWLSYMMPYIILLRERDQVVIINSIPVWYNILVSKANSRTSKVNVLAGIACALNLPVAVNTLALHDKSDMQDAIIFEVMNYFRKSIVWPESIIRLADIPHTWYLLEPFSLALSSLSSNIRFDAYPTLEGSAYWALKIAFDAILLSGSSDNQVRPVLNVRRIYEGALRLCGCIVRQAGTTSAIEEFHDRVSKLKLPPDPDSEVEKKLFDILMEADESNLDLAADALLVLGVIGGPFPLSFSVLDQCVATIDACLRKSWYHRSTALYAIWAARRRLQNSRIVQLGSRLLPSFIHITPSLQNLTDLHLSLMLSRIAIKDTSRELSASERNALSKLSLGIRDLQGSLEEKLSNFNRLPNIQFIDLCMLLDGRRDKASSKSFAPIIPANVLADICIRGWKRFNPHGYHLLFGRGPKFWNTKTDSIIITWIYTQLYLDFPSIMFSFVLWTSNTLGSLIGEQPESVHRKFSGDVLTSIREVTNSIIAFILEEDGFDHGPIKYHDSTDSTTILDCVTKFFGQEDLAALTSVREKELKNLLVAAKNLEKILTEFNNLRVDRIRDS